ncbi:hypothetical protein BDV36DRAFT_112134 [Aspergillus pseudocaelatus]|uniref:Uncharacterized protein n=1 Tax=Aspergillus pseudocaelatus TaxID=1825620 RepID=A0ABQ6W0S6_9EURO|nr:hypothetical protein BDV36DRAFT_112134 [Aspergillus pseudocaelatus]
MGTCPSCSNITCKDRWTSSFEVKSHDIHDVSPFFFIVSLFSFQFPLSSFLFLFFLLFLVLVGHIYWRMSLIDCVFLTLVDFGPWFSLLLLFFFFFFPYSASCLEYYGVNTSFHSIPLPACCIVLFRLADAVASFSSLHFNRSLPRCYDVIPREFIPLALTPGSKIISLGCSLSSFSTLNLCYLPFVTTCPLIRACLTIFYILFRPSLVRQFIKNLIL